MPKKDPNTRKHFRFKEEQVTDSGAKTKTRTRVDCNYCSMLRAADLVSWAVDSNLDRLRCHLTGDDEICKTGVNRKGNGGICACPAVPEEVADEFTAIVRARQQEIQARADAKRRNKRIAEGLKAIRREKALNEGKQPDEEDEVTTGPFTPLPDGNGECRAWQSRKRMKVNQVPCSALPEPHRAAASALLEPPHTAPPCPSRAPTALPEPPHAAPPGRRGVFLREPDDRPARAAQEILPEDGKGDPGGPRTPTMC